MGYFFEILIYIFGLLDSFVRFERDEGGNSFAERKLR